MAYKESNLDSISNLLELDWHIIKKQVKIFEEYQDNVSKEMDKIKKESSLKTPSKPRLRK